MDQKHYLRVINHADRDPIGCLISRYSVGSHGYAQAWDGTRNVLAHRLVWEFVRGPIPDGMTVDHVCHVKTCIEITHLRLLSNFDNARRNRPGDWPTGQCRQGHDDSLWHKPPNSKGYCTACRIRYQRRYRARKVHKR